MTYQWEEDDTFSICTTTPGGYEALIERDDMGEGSDASYSWSIRLTWYSLEDGQDWEDVADDTAATFFDAVAQCESKLDELEAISEAAEAEMRDAEMEAMEWESRMAQIEADQWEVEG